MQDWGPRAVPEIDYVQDYHTKLLNKLIDMQVDGFRVDAIKHIPRDYIKSAPDSGKGELTTMV